MTDTERTQLICDLTELSKVASSVIPGADAKQLRQLLEVVERSNAAADELRALQSGEKFLTAVQLAERPN